MHISSLQNPRIKNVVKLQSRRRRDRQQLTVVEGVREVARALANGFWPQAAFYCPELIQGAVATAVVEQLQTSQALAAGTLFTVSPEVFAKLAYRGDSGGILMVLPYWTRPLADLALSNNPLLVIIEGGEKPGNLGAILRSADAAGVDAVLISEDEERRGTDIYNPNVIRASLGALFTVPVVTAGSGVLINWLGKHQVQIAAAVPEGSRLYTEANLKRPVALVMGSEAFGLSPQWLTAADLQLVIPMQGQVDSLNLSVATALMMFEVVRQRGSGYEN